MRKHWHHTILGRLITSSITTAITATITVTLLCGLTACQGQQDDPLTATAAPGETVAETIRWPEPDDFHRADDAGDPLTAVFEADDDPYMGFSVTAVSANAAQMDAFGQGWSDETEAFLSEMLPGSITGHETVDLPGLNRQGIQLELDLGVQDDPDPLIMRALFFTADGQLIQVLAFNKTSGYHNLQAAWDQFIGRIRAE